MHFYIKGPSAFVTTSGKEFFAIMVGLFRTNQRGALLRPKTAERSTIGKQIW